MYQSLPVTQDVIWNYHPYSSGLLGQLNENSLECTVKALRNSFIIVLLIRTKSTTDLIRFDNLKLSRQVANINYYYVVGAEKERMRANVRARECLSIWNEANLQFKVMQHTIWTLQMLAGLDDKCSEAPFGTFNDKW